MNENQEVEEFLSHYGVKGMKWGVRRKRGPNGRVKSTEAKQVERIIAKKKTKGIRSLTNKELADVNKRLNMETQFKKMNPSRIKAGHAAIAGVLALGATVNTAIAFAGSPAGKMLKDKLSK